MNQAYYNGEFYQCVTATNAGESPATHPAKWRKISMLKDWRWPLAKLTYANLLELDGQKDKATAERTVALITPGRGLEEVVRRRVNRELQGRFHHQHHH